MAPGDQHDKRATVPVAITRDPIADQALLAMSRRMTISERLESALNFNRFAAGLREATAVAKQERKRA